MIMIGERLRARRLELGLTLRQVEVRARSHGGYFPTHYLGQIERGEVKRFGPDKLRVLALALETSADRLLGLDVA